MCCAVIRQRQGRTTSPWKALSCATHLRQGHQRLQGRHPVAVMGISCHDLDVWSPRQQPSPHPPAASPDELNLQVRLSPSSGPEPKRRLDDTGNVGVWCSPEGRSQPQPLLSLLLGVLWFLASHIYSVTPSRPDLTTPHVPVWAIKQLFARLKGSPCCCSAPAS